MSRRAFLEMSFTRFSLTAMTACEMASASSARKAFTSTKMIPEGAST